MHHDPIERARGAALQMLETSRRRTGRRGRPRPGPPVTGLGLTGDVLMVARLAGRRSTGSVPAGLAVVRRLASDEAGTFADVVGRAFGVPPEAVARVYTAEALANPLIGAYVAETHSGLPVAAGAGILCDGHLGIANVGTVDGFRTEGYARVLTETVLRRGETAGAHTAYLHASEDTVAFFERLGFVARPGWTLLRAS
ncbi:GNAT family N-acetyltransferase [Actinoplanes sp. URMC 104]|uniref:GNAT family N-acetyltransferase n=1 Tax=Actinoplanes sp. URMC 104 TaxID=3423409 RepID=UPI003F1D0CCC